MARSKVLVLLAAFNGSRWIAEQVQTILDQVDVDIYLIISDDGSTDSTRTELQAFARDRRVRVTSTVAPTGSAAQNFLQLIRRTPSDGYDFVALADQDDTWLPDKLSRACDSLARSEASAYSAAVTAYWGNGRKRVVHQVDRPTVSDFLFEGAGQGCTFVMTADFYTRLREFFMNHISATAPVHYHDWVIYALARSWGLKWTFDQTPSMHYRQHGDNDTGARASIDGVFKRLIKIRTGWYSAQLFAVANICLAASPSNPIIKEWNDLIHRKRGVTRKYDVVKFCLKGGRRRGSDKSALLAAAIAGWI